MTQTVLRGRGRREALGGIAAGVLLASGCSLVTTIPDLTGGSVDASPDGPVADAPALGDARGEAGMDGNVQADGGAPESAPTDAPQDTQVADAPADAPLPDSGFPAGSWCAQQPAAGMILCDDFDFDTLSFPRWSSVHFDVSGSDDFSNTAVSPPHSLETNVPAHTSTSYFEEMLEKDFPGLSGASQVSLDFQFQPVSFAPDAGISQDLYVATLVQGFGAPRVAVALQTGTDGTLLREQITDSTGHDTFNTSQSSSMVPPSGSFTHFVLTVTFGSPSTATLSYGGTTLVTLTLQGTWQPQTGTTVVLGDWYLVSTPGFDLLYDDAVVRQQ